MSVDVRCLPYMPLHIERLRRSKAWLRCKRRPELAFYLMNLWMRAWHEVPAGSIEADDDVLADAAMCSPDEWERIKPDVLQGWEERDGRWHHHVVTELAAEGVQKVEASRRRTEAARQVRQQNRERSATSSVTETVTSNVTPIVTGSKEKEKGREDLSDADASGADAPPAAPTYTDARHELYGEGKPILLSLGVAEKQCGAMITRWLRDTGDDCAGILDAIRRARDERVMDPIPWITRALPTRPCHDRSDRLHANRGPTGASQFNAALADAVARRTVGRDTPGDPGSDGAERARTGSRDGELFAADGPSRCG